MALVPFSSKIITDTGISYGDEGKGRLIPEVAAEIASSGGTVNMVLKVNGGANSGHTVGALKLNLLPAGVIVREVPLLGIGAGVVADPRKFRWEMAYSAHLGYPVAERLLIDERTMISDISHRLLDLAWEDYRHRVLGEPARGSTGRGISPAFGEETSHFVLHYSLFRGPKDAFAAQMKSRCGRALDTIRYVCATPAEVWFEFFQRLTQAEMRANELTLGAGVFAPGEFDFSHFCGREPFTLEMDNLIDAYWEAGVELVANIGDIREAVLRALAADQFILAEFGQSFWLDKRQGFCPNLTASHTFVPEFFQSAGVPFQRVHNIGVCKAYDTKVGTHTFIARFPDGHPLGERLKTLEFGVSTGRQRMVGWFDAVEKGDALRYGGAQDLCFNKLDALTLAQPSEGPLKICVAYETPEGQRLRHVPRDSRLHASLRPVYVELPGWEQPIGEVRRWPDLPSRARAYVVRCLRETLAVAGEGLAAGGLPTTTNLRYIGVGPHPHQIIKDIPSTTDLLRENE